MHYLSRLLLKVQRTYTSGTIYQCLLRTINFIEKYQRIRGANNQVNIKGLLASSKIIVNGDGNTIIIGKNATCYGLLVQMTGNNCTLTIDEGVTFLSNNSTIVILGSNCEIRIEKNCYIKGDVRMIAIDQGCIYIQEESLIANRVSFLAGDGHDIFQHGELVNKPAAIYIGKKVWIGEDAKILKGVTIQDNTVIGAASIVTKSPSEGNAILAGNPAIVVKKTISWRS